MCSAAHDGLKAVLGKQATAATQASHLYAQVCAGQAGATHQHPPRDPGVPSCLAQPPEHPHAIYSRMAEAAAAPVACMKLFPRPFTGLAAGRKLQLDPGSLAATLQQSRGLVGLDPRLYVTEQALGLQVGLSRSEDSKLA